LTEIDKKVVRIMSDELKCQNCNHLNKIQKFCGNCGSRLIFLQEEIYEKERIIVRNKMMNKAGNIVGGIIAFVAIWIIGSAILNFVLSESDRIFSGGIAFLVGLVVMLFMIFGDFGKKEIQQDDQANT
jgi:hypothetical protein